MLRRKKNVRWISNKNLVIFFNPIFNLKFSSLGLFFSINKKFKGFFFYILKRHRVQQQFVSKINQINNSLMIRNIEEVLMVYTTRLFATGQFFLMILLSVYIVVDHISRMIVIVFYLKEVVHLAQERIIIIVVQKILSLSIVALRQVLCLK